MRIRRFHIRIENVHRVGDLCSSLGNSERVVWSLRERWRPKPVVLTEKHRQSLTVQIQVAQCDAACCGKLAARIAAEDARIVAHTVTTERLRITGPDNRVAGFAQQCTKESSVGLGCPCDAN